MRQRCRYARREVLTEDTLGPLTELARLLQSHDAAAAFNPSGALVRMLATTAISLAVLTGSPSALPASSEMPGTLLGSPLAREAVDIVQRGALDRTFNGVDLKQVGQQLEKDGPLTEEQAIRKARNLIKSVGDPYAKVMSPEGYQRLLSRFELFGAGINLEFVNNGELMINAVPLPDSSASREGLMMGDRVTAINGKTTRGMRDFDVISELGGNADAASLQVKAKGGATREVVLRKSVENNNPVKYKIYDANDGSGKIGYIKLKEFNAASKRRMREAVSDLVASGAPRIIIDLRFNGGGSLEAAAGIAGFFLDRPLVVYATSAKEAMQPLYSTEPIISADVPLQVWVNQYSASASEVLAAALHDNCRATIVGEKTYGKGVIQQLYGLSNGGAVIQTTYKYATPKREDINNKGIQPDVQRPFISDIGGPFGAFFVNQDVKATSFSSGATSTACRPAIAASNT